MSNHKSDSGIFKFITGLLLGLIGGVVAGILLARKPGRELRKDLELSSEEIIHNIRDKFDDFRDRAQEHLKDFKGYTDEKFRTSAMNIKDKAQDLGKQLDELTKKRGHFADSSKN